MSRLAPRLAVCLQAAGQLRDVHAAQTHEDRQTHAPNPGERLGGGRRHSDERMRRAIRARRDRDIVESIEPSREAEGLALPGGEDDLQRLEETLLALLVGNAEGV